MRSGPHRSITKANTYKRLFFIGNSLARTVTMESILRKVVNQRPRVEILDSRHYSEPPLHSAQRRRGSSESPQNLGVGRKKFPRIAFLNALSSIVPLTQPTMLPEETSQLRGRVSFTPNPGLGFSESLLAPPMSRNKRPSSSGISLGITLSSSRRMFSRYDTATARTMTSNSSPLHAAAQSLRAIGDERHPVHAASN